MAERRGRPVLPGIRGWENDETFVPKVASIFESRDTSDEETLTEVTYAVETLAKETVPEERLTERRRGCLRRLAAYARPSRIARTLLSWRLNLPDRTIRHIQQREDLKGIAELWWA